MKKIQSVYSSLIRVLSENWRKNYTKDNTNDSYGFATNDLWPVTFQEAYHVAKVELSSTIETTMYFDGVRYTKEVIQMSVELLANYILSMLNSL